MILDRWVDDAEKLASSLPKNNPLAARLGYLLRDVATRGVSTDLDIFNKPASSLPYSAESAFLVINRSLLKHSPTRLGRSAMYSPAIAFVAHGPGSPDVLVLPDYNPSRPLLNGGLLLHELEHLTEDQEGLTTASTGKRERRAYQLNTAILHSLDGSDFDRFIDNWPVTFSSQASNSALDTSISFDDVVCPIPPQETYAHSLWQESDDGKRLLQSIGRMTVLERLARGLPESHVDRLADGLQLAG